MDYTAARPVFVENVTIRDIIKFFVNYISYDNLGQIANAHLATADIAANGARDGKCILLAQLHSEAVDFSKSGKPALMTEDLRVNIFPDFMQKKDKESYPSKKVLGRIFRAIDKSDYKNYQDGLEENLEKKKGSLYDPRLRVAGMELYIAEAREKRALYNRNLSALMNQFGVQTEAEICSGYVIKWLKKGNSKTKYTQREYTMKAVKAFKALWKKEFEKEFYDDKNKVNLSSRDKIEAKAAAWYYVTYHPQERARDITAEGGFLSFPWCIYEYICEIAKTNTHKRLDDPKYKEAIDEAVIKERAEKLLHDRGNAPLVVDVSDDEVSDDDGNYVDYNSDASSDDEIYTYNATKIIANGGNGGSSAAAAAVATAMGRANNDINRNIGIILNPITPRPLESHQSVIPVDATADDLARVLLGE